jgi:hypothetical protein
MTNKDTQTLVDKIRDAGFTCEINGAGHWAVTDPDGRHMGSFSTTPNGAQSLRNAISDLKKTTGVDFGAVRRTARKADRPVNTTPDPRTLALLADRNRNDAALEEAQRVAATRAAQLKERLESEERQSMTARDTGPTKEELDAEAMQRAVQRALNEIPGSLKYPVTQPPRLMTYTPAQMRELLDSTVCNTRPPMVSTVDKYRDAMARGEWRVTHQGIAIDWHGCLVDGRQRFTAAIKAGMDLTIYATYGVDPATFFAMDIGKNRTASDAISISGVKWHVTADSGKQKELKPSRVHMGAAVGICLNLDYRDPATNEPYPRYQVEHVQYSREQIVHALATPHPDGAGFDEGPYFDMGYYTSLAGELRRHAKLTMTAGYVGLFMARRAHPNAPHGIWHNQLVTGANLSLKSPALKLREALANSSAQAARPGNRGGLTTLAQYAIYVKAWNAFLEGKEIGQLRWRDGEEIPEPINPAVRRR